MALSDEYLDKRSLTLCQKHGVRTEPYHGAYLSAPLHRVEFLLHEVAHWITLGNSIEKVPTKLPSRIEKALKGMTQDSSNSLEFDAAIVTFRAGHSLGLWKDPMPIARSCQKNLRGRRALSLTFDETLKALDHRKACKEVITYSEALARWFSPGSKGKLLPFDTIFDRYLSETA